MDNSDEEAGPSLEAAEEYPCVCPPVVQNIDDPTYRPGEPENKGCPRYPHCLRCCKLLHCSICERAKCPKCSRRRPCPKHRSELQLRCPGDVTVREGENALTVVSLAEKYDYRSPMELDADSGESLGSAGGDYDLAEIERRIENLQAAMPEGPQGQEAIEEVIRDGDWAGERLIPRREEDEENRPASESSSSD